MKKKAKKIGEVAWDKLPAFEVDKQHGKWIGIGRVKITSKTETERFEIVVTGDDPLKVLGALAKATKHTLKAMNAIAVKAGVNMAVDGRKV